jgi:uncharacterized protein GlcG (DUF336 family)
MSKRIDLVPITVALVLATSPAWSDQNNGATQPGNANCKGLPTASQLREFLNAAPGTGGTVGGLFDGTRMWAAVVNRDGEICAYATGGSPAAAADSRSVWPASQAIAKAKAFTANSLNVDDVPPLSTARLYTLVQPGHSLYGVNHSNPFDPKYNIPPSGNGPSRGQIAAGLITFGGGVALYSGSRVMGGLGVSGDTACADHEIAKRVRMLAGMDPPGGALVDDIKYSAADGPSIFSHPACINTWRNGVKIPDDETAHLPPY